MRPRREIETLDICPHGGPNYAELERLGLKPEDVLDFSVSANPFGPPSGIKEALNSVIIDRYPDSNSTELKHAIAENTRVSPDNIIAGNGSMELIRIIVSAYLGRDDKVIIPSPTFGEYEIACRIAGSNIIEHRTKDANNFKLNIKAIVDSIQRHQPRAIFLCNPNNPTGQYLARDEIERILTAGKNAMVILDEAYISFVDNPWNSLDLINADNIIIMRSMTKDYALAGLRLGYAIANPDIIGTLQKVCPPWTVNAVAQIAGTIALQDLSYIETCQERIRQAGQFLQEELTKTGLLLLPSKAHFFLVKTGNAWEFRQALLKYGIMIRDCTSFGLPEYVRIAPRSVPECERLIAAVRKIQE
ncbi:MAG: histidinol-phosphate transaminase [Chloroflexota bacterium]|nr:histidinol-phosphate transaminase [Chloroflexota bacterium]